MSADERCCDCGNVLDWCVCEPDDVGVATTLVGEPLVMLWERRGRVVHFVFGRRQ